MQDKIFGLYLPGKNSWMSKFTNDLTFDKDPSNLVWANLCFSYSDTLNSSPVIFIYGATSREQSFQLDKHSNKEGIME